MGTEYALFDPRAKRALEIGKLAWDAPGPNGTQARGPSPRRHQHPEMVAWITAWVERANGAPIELWNDSVHAGEEPWIDQDDDGATAHGDYTVHYLRGHGFDREGAKPWPEFVVGDLVTRDGTDTHRVTGTWPEGACDPTQLDLVCEIEPKTGWAEVGERGSSPASRYKVSKEAS